MRKAEREKANGHESSDLCAVQLRQSEGRVD